MPKKQLHKKSNQDYDPPVKLSIEGRIEEILLRLERTHDNFARLKKKLSPVINLATDQTVLLDFRNPPNSDIGNKSTISQSLDLALHNLSVIERDIPEFMMSVDLKELDDECSVSKR